MIMDANERSLPRAAGRSHCFCVVRIDSLLEAIPGERAIHGARIDVDVAERFRDELRVGALAAGAGTVDCNDYGRIQMSF